LERGYAVVVDFVALGGSRCGTQGQDGGQYEVKVYSHYCRMFGKWFYYLDFQSLVLRNTKVSSFFILQVLSLTSSEAITSLTSLTSNNINNFLLQVLSLT
jgi:hypothetical protein